MGQVRLKVCGTKRGTVVADDEFGEVVARIDGGCPGAPTDWALLFAAAPDLLETLKEAESALRWASQEAAGRVKQEIVGGWLHHAEQARAAIAKAEGN